MNRPTSGAARLLRAALLSSLVVGLAAGAHAVAGGAVPSMLVLAGLAALVLPVAVVVTGRRVRAVGALALLGVGQVVLHSGFGLLARCGAAGGGELLAGSGLAETAGPHAGHAVVTAGHACGAHVGGHASSTMLAAHAAATVVTALLVVGAERGLWGVLAYLAPLMRPVRPLVVPVPPRLSVTSAPRTRPVALHLRVPPARRGPPAPARLAYALARAA